jgi:hypothetical protein
MKADDSLFIPTIGLRADISRLEDGEDGSNCSKKVENCYTVRPFVRPIPAFFLLFLRIWR